MASSIVKKKKATHRGHNEGSVYQRKDGKWMYYSISEEGLCNAQKYIDYLKENSNYEINKNKDKMSESFKAYILSFIPYFIMLFFDGSEVGGFTFFGEYSTLYGWDAMMWRLIFFYSPIYLGLFIFQLIYTIIK